MSDPAQATAASAPASPKKTKSTAAKKPKATGTAKVQKAKAPANHPTFIEMAVKAVQVSDYNF